MSKEDTDNTEGQGLPGYPANSSVPTGFILPVPAASAPEPSTEPADPWSTTWEDTSWHTAVTVNGSGSQNGYDSYTSSYDTDSRTSSLDDTATYNTYNGTWAPAGSPDPSINWADSYDHGGSDTSSDVSSATTGDTSSWGAWDTYGTDSTASGTGVTDTHWSDLQHNADVDAASTEEYSAWAPAGSTSFSTDHRTAEQAYAAAPPVDPDVAAASAELGRDLSSTAYDTTPVAREGNSDRPSADDLITVRSKGERQKTKATSGLRRAFGLGPGAKELLERNRIDRIARPLNGRKTIMVINTKGGGGKTLVTLMLASYLGRYRSGSVLAWDNNETEGTLGMRAPSQPHHRTVVDLLAALPQIAADPNAGSSELEHWVREQRALSFDVLASADDDEAMRIIGEQEFESLHTQLSRFYRMIIIDTGNNRLSPNWLAAAAKADMLVFATSLKDDTSVVAAKNLDALVTMGRHDLVKNAVCVISHTSAKGNDLGAGVHTREHFEQWVRAVVDIPYDPMLAPGLNLDPLKIAKRTHDSCMEMAAVVVDGL